MGGGSESRSRGGEESRKPPSPHHHTRKRVPAPSPAFDLLTGLLDKSLLQLGQAEAHEPRFLMLETVREFALERLAECGEAEAIAAAHAAYMLDLAERAEPHLPGPDERWWLSRCDAELGNLRAALAWSVAHDVETALRIGAALWFYWAWYQLPEGLRWLTAGLARPAPVSALLRARALTVHGALAVMSGDAITCFASGADAVASAVQAGDALAEARARWIGACGHLYADTVASAPPLLDRALPLFEQATTTADRSWGAYAWYTRGAASFLLGDKETGRVHYEEALARIRAAGSDGLTLLFLSDFAGWLIELGETAQARDMLAEALTIGADHGGVRLVASTLISLALIDALEGEAATSARRLGAVEALWPLTGLAIAIHYQLRVDRAAARARDALGDDAFAAAWAAGRADPSAVLAAAMHRAEPTGTTVSSARTGKAEQRRVLSRREQQVLPLLIDGRSDREIADALFVSQRTASNHVSAILRKLGAGSRAEAAVRAVRDGLV
ncbi:MAG: helix-turn-helix domain-containing protein [Thermomicrobiales bacterium]